MSDDVADRLMRCLETNIMPDRQLTGDARARIVWLESQLAEAIKDSAAYAALRHIQEMRRILGDPRDCCVVPTSGKQTFNERNPSK